MVAESGREREGRDGLRLAIGMVELAFMRVGA